jgi:hypothetical protein
MRKVTYAKVHEALFVPEVGPTQNTLSLKETGSKVLSMKAHDSFLEVIFKGKFGKDVSVLVPYPNVVLMQVDTEEAPKK